MLEMPFDFLDKFGTGLAQLQDILSRAAFDLIHCGVKLTNLLFELLGLCCCLGEGALQPA